MHMLWCCEGEVLLAGALCSVGGTGVELLTHGSVRHLSWIGYNYIISGSSTGCTGAGVGLLGVH